MGDASATGQIITALAGFVGVVVGSLISWGVQASLLGRRIEADKGLAKGKFEFDKELAERKFSQEKAQLIHRRRFELADALLADAYRFRDLMRYVRSSVSFEGEGETRKSIEAEPESTKRTKDNYFVPIERLQRESEFISAFMAKEYAAHAHFGPEATQAFGLFRQSVRRVQTASGMLIETVGMPNNNPEFVHEMRGDLWERDASVRKKDDEVARQIEDGVTLFEGFCRPVLEWIGA